ncbi:Uu.00g077820.m01.CDS01 [Anthostomella pinea]|uniref:Uu.00g077820.m01.CDS01 n=1 Tax=Anthostomella pinea TaxID=933095 RepID=A0AAI8VLG1_9PEZI|nr:Uu.00g077820.m01.CDS01 [Anthostomella pinea]
MYMTIKIGKPLLGLSKVEYDLLASEVDVVVYNSWRLDFGLAIRSFDPFLKATRGLVELAAASKENNMRVVFVSSTSSVEVLAAGDTVPEAPVEDHMAAMNTGYGQSKLAAEGILVTACRQAGIPVSIARVGQVGGLSRGTGAWPDQPWISTAAGIPTT